MGYPRINISLVNNIHCCNENYIDSRKVYNKYFYCLIKYVKVDDISISIYTVNISRVNTPVIFRAKSAQVVCKLLESHVRINNQLSVSHALYLGRELMKAEFAMISGQNYIQN